MAIESDPTILARPSLLPSLNGKTKVVSAGGGISILTAIGYLFYALAQQPVIDSQQDASIDRVEAKAEATNELVISKMDHMSEMNRLQHDAMLTAIKELKE